MTSLTCAVCRSEFRRKPYEAKRTRCCSRACSWKQRFVDALARWEKRVKEPIGAYLRRRYVDELASYRDLMAALKLNEVRTLRKALGHFGIPIRRGSDAVATQWIDADERKRETADRMRVNVAPWRGRFARGNQSSPREDKIARWIRELGIEVRQQEPIPERMDVSASRRAKGFKRTEVFHVDILMPSLNVGLEVYGNKSLLDSRRHGIMLRRKLRMMYVPNRYADRNRKTIILREVLKLRDGAKASVEFGWPKATKQAPLHSDMK